MDHLTIWNVTIEAAGPAATEVSTEALNDLLTILESYDPVVTGPPAEPVDGLARYGADLTITAASAPEQAVYLALSAFGQAAEKVGLPMWPVVRVEVMTDEELDAELTRPGFPVLLGVAELAERLDVSRQRASELARTSTFPPPVCTLAAGPVWLEASVNRYLENWRRRPGRPPQASTGSR